MAERLDNPKPTPPPVEPEGDGHRASGTPFHSAVRYETADAKFRWILGCLVAFSILAVVIFFVIWRFFIGYTHYQAEIKRSHYPLGGSVSEALPAEPRLEQINRLAGIEKSNVYMREASKEAILHSYGSTKNDEFVHIPIERAMDLLAQQESRRKGSSTQEKHNGLVGSGASNSGRMFREKSP